MLLKLILPLLLLMPTFATAEVKELKSHTLFNFTGGKADENIAGWKTHMWHEHNTTSFKYAGERGARLTFPKGVGNSAPNVFFQWNPPADWSEYNFLELDLYNPSNEVDILQIDLRTDNAKARVSHHSVHVPPKKDVKIKIPFNVYRNWAPSPANFEKVRVLSLIRRIPPRELNFYIKSIRLLSLEAPERRFEFDGLAAYQFGAAGQTPKDGFQLIPPDSPLWSGAERTVDTVKTGYDTLWDTMTTGTGPAELSLPAKPGKYLVFVLLHGRIQFARDTKLELGRNSYRHLICNGYPEYRLIRAEAGADGKLKLKLSPGTPHSRWGITAVVVMDAGKAETLMREFTWPMYDDMAVAPWSLRGFMAEKRENIPSDFQVTEWDFYTGKLKEFTSLNNNFFSVFIPNDTNEFAITCPPGVKVQRAMLYSVRDLERFVRNPRFFQTVDGSFSIRGGQREYFRLESDKDASGVLEISADGRRMKVPFKITATQLPAPSDNINYFLYYYQFGFGGGPESVRLQLLQERKELEFIRMNGFSSIEIPMGCAVKYENDNFKFNFASTINFMKRLRKYWPEAKGIFPVFLVQQLRPINQTLGKTDYLWDEKLYEKSIPVVQEFVRQCEVVARENNWPKLAYYPFDEFGNHEYTAKMHRAIKEAGGMTYSTSVGSYGNSYNISSGDGLDIYCFPDLEGADMGKMTAAADKINAQIWRYSIESSRPLLDRYMWGLSAWQLGLKGYGAWHFDGRNFSISELQNGSYYYAYAAIGNGEIMPSLALLGVRDAMLDYAALIAVEKSGKAQQLLDELRQDAARLGPNPGEQTLQQWFNAGGREKLTRLRALARE